MSDTEDPNNPDPNLTIPDFHPQPTTDSSTVDELTAFFNTPQIKKELHWFTRRETLQRAFDRDDRELFYIRLKDTIVSAAMVWCESRVLDPHQAQIRLVATAPDYRYRGFAQMLIQSAISFAQAEDKTEIIADVAADSPATDFWNQCGFHPKEEYETDGGRIMIRMSREI